jgi:23S rRNA pseudouridine1911/1915/1917 synthase
VANLFPRVIYENNDFLVIDKPSGLEVAAEIKKDEPTLVDWLVEKYPTVAKVGGDPVRPGIIHRLDKSASGLLAVAKTQAVFDNLIKQFEERKIKKEYTVLVHGQVSKDEGTIDFPIARAKSGRFAALPLGSEKGRVAITEYEVIKRFRNFTLLKVKIRTGRTHQIRVHLRAIDHSVVGDKLYKQKKIKKIILERLFLHASKLGFYNLAGEWKEFEIGLPVELKEFLKTL